MTDRDLTPAEARAEVEAFMGEGWTHQVASNGDDWWIRSTKGFITLFGCGQSYRAVLHYLKQSWRDAVRPWVEAGCAHAYNDVDRYGQEQQGLDAIVVRVLGEDK